MHNNIQILKHANISNLRHMHTYILKSLIDLVQNSAPNADRQCYPIKINKQKNKDENGSLYVSIKV